MPIFCLSVLIDEHILVCYLLLFDFFCSKTRVFYICVSVALRVFLNCCRWFFPPLNGWLTTHFYIGKFGFDFLCIEGKWEGRKDVFTLLWHELSILVKNWNYMYYSLLQNLGESWNYSVTAITKLPSLSFLNLKFCWFLHCLYYRYLMIYQGNELNLARDQHGWIQGGMAWKAWSWRKHGAIRNLKIKF